MLPPRRSFSLTLFEELVELTLMDGPRLIGVVDWGDEFVLECRECELEGFTSFDKKFGAIWTNSHQIYEQLYRLSPLYAQIARKALSLSTWVFEDIRAFPRAMLVAAARDRSGYVNSARSVL